MNTPSVMRFEGKVKSGGTVLLNQDTVELRPKRGDIEVVSVPVNTIADKLGSLRSANMVMVGAFAQKTGVVSLETVINSVKDIFAAKGSKVHEINTLAIKEGAAFADKVGQS
jgi:2-oxoglutarate ferredoxin oxidoreductase subunit gamma